MDPTTKGWIDHEEQLKKQQEHYRKLREINQPKKPEGDKPVEVKKILSR